MEMKIKKNERGHNHDENNSLQAMAFEEGQLSRYGTTPVKDKVKKVPSKNWCPNNGTVNARKFVMFFVFNSFFLKKNNPKDTFFALRMCV